MLRAAPLVVLAAVSVSFSWSEAARAQCTAGQPYFTDACLDGTHLRACVANDGGTAGHLEDFDCAAATTGGACSDELWTCASGNVNPCATWPACVTTLPGGGCRAQLQASSTEYGWWGCQGGASVCSLGYFGGYTEACTSIASGTCAHGELHKGCASESATRCVVLDGLPGQPFTLADPIATHCPSFGGSCMLDGDGMPYCDLQEGDPCMDAEFTATADMLRCGAGLVCVGDDFYTLGTCVDASSVDAGPADDGGAPVDSGGGDAGSPSGDGGGGVDGGGMAADGGPAVVDDGGAPHGEGGSVFDDECGELLPQGECDGTTLRWCQAGRVAARDCADDELVCAEVGPATGFACVDGSMAVDGGAAGTFSLYCACAAAGSSGARAAALVVALFALAFRRRRRGRSPGATARRAC